MNRAELITLLQIERGLKIALPSLGKESEVVDGDPD